MFARWSAHDKLFARTNGRSEPAVLSRPFWAGRSEKAVSRTRFSHAFLEAHASPRGLLPAASPQRIYVSSNELHKRLKASSKRAKSFSGKSLTNSYRKSPLIPMSCSCFALCVGSPANELSPPPVSEMRRDNSNHEAACVNDHEQPLE